MGSYGGLPSRQLPAAQLLSKSVFLHLSGAQEEEQAAFAKSESYFGCWARVEFDDVHYYSWSS